MRATYNNAPNPGHPAHLIKPLPQQFGLPSFFDAADYLEEITKRKKLHERIIFGAAYVIALFAIMYGLYGVAGGGDPSKFFLEPGLYVLPAFFACIGCMPINYWFNQLYARHVGDLAEPEARAYLDATSVYRKAVQDWNERQTESGQTYWKEKRGVAFEEAVKALLSRRGCAVQTTKGSGDGGVDLIAMFGSSTFWCQCKGHASPVGVAVVREIAGVCSRGGGVPVVIAVNGYTKAAVETAQQLGVLLIDTHNLVNMATQQRLSQWH